jgi:hypothetical protein
MEATQSPATTDVAHLAEFKDVTEKIDLTLKDDTFRPVSATFPTKTPKELLERNYTVATFNWTSGMTQQLINFPGTLFEQVAIANVLDNYKYFRANVSVQIKIQSTPFHQGSLLIGWLPGWDGASTVSLSTLSGCNPVVLSATAETSVTVKIPYLLPNDWLDTELPPGIDSRIGTLFISELNPLIPTSPNQSTSLPVNVFANFVDSEVQTPQSLIPALSRVRRIAKMHTGKAHSKQNQEAQKKASRGTDWSGTKFAMSMASKLFRMAPVVGPIWGTFADFMNGVDGEWSKPLDHTAQMPTLNAPFTDYSKARDLTTADEISLYPNALITSGKVLHNMETSHIPIAKLAQRPMLYDRKTMSSTSTLYTWVVTPLCTTYDMEGATGNTDWLSEMSRVALYWRGSIKYLFHFVAPAFYSARVIIYYSHQSGGVNTIDELPHIIIDVKGETFYELCIPYSRGYTWTDHIAESQTPGNVPTLNLKLLTSILGSTAPTTPVLYCNIWRAGGEDTAFQGTSNPVGNLVTTAGGIKSSTMHFGKAHCSVDAKFSKPFNNIAGSLQSFERGDIAAEIIGTAADLCKRASDISTDLNVNNATFPQQFLPGTSPVNGGYWTAGCEYFHYMSAFFLFWRGSRILRRFLNPGVNGTIMAMGNYGDNATWSDGATYWANGVRTFAPIRDAVQVHWQSQAPYEWIGQPGVHLNSTAVAIDGVATSIPNDIRAVPASVSTSFTLVSGGDDFTLLYPVPFFPSTYYPLIPATTASKNKKVNTLPEPGDSF